MKPEAEPKSEAMFREYCRNAGWFVWRVRTRDKAGLERPDFVVWRWWRRLAVEVKQIDPNRYDLEQQRRFDSGGIAQAGGMPGERLREHIKKASSQLKALTECRWPGIVVILDTTVLATYADAYHIKAAMHGLEELVFEKTGPQKPLSRFVGYRFGGKRRVTPNTGTAISAVCRIERDSQGVAWLSVFHNEHAACRLDHHWWGGAHTRHYVLGDPDHDARRDWKELLVAG